MPASTDDILTAIKNIVTALNTANQTSINIVGSQNLAGISTPTLVKTGPGRVVRASVVVAGSTDGVVIDGNSLGATTVMALIPMAIGIYEINLPLQYGLVVGPGTGMNLTVSYS